MAFSNSGSCICSPICNNNVFINNDWELIQLDILSVYKKSKSIGEKHKFKNKYTWAGFYRLISVRYFSLNDTFSKQTELNDFVRRNGSILIFPNKVNGEIVSALARSIDNNAMLRFKSTNLPYGVGTLRPEFKYGDPMFVVEGIADWAGVKLLGKNIDVVAMETNEISKDMYEVYSSITNNIVLIPDNDDAGHNSARRMKFRFRELGVTVNTIEQFGTLKDTGEILERTMMSDKTKSQALRDELKLIATYYRAKINQYRGK